MQSLRLFKPCVGKIQKNPKIQIAMESPKPKNAVICISVLLICCLCSSCASQSQSPPLPCDPQPPCLPARSQPFGFSFKLSGKHRRLLPSLIRLVSARSEATISAVADPQFFSVQFDKPEKLDWQNDDTFKALLSLDGSEPDTLLATVRQITMDCCPQLVLDALYINGKKLCKNCNPTEVIKFP